MTPEEQADKFNEERQFLYPIEPPDYKDAFLSGYKAAQEWVKIQEGCEMPTKYSEVLFIVMGTEHYEGRILGGRYTGTPGDEYFHNEFSTPGHGFCATHWKYSPPSPPINK